MIKNNIIDLTEALAKTITLCDNCKKEIGQHYARTKGSVSVNLPDGEDEQGYQKNKEVHTCSAACLKEYMNKNH